MTDEHQHEDDLTERVTVRFTPRELEAIYDAAASAGVNPSAFIRRAATVHARQLQLFPPEKRRTRASPLRHTRRNDSG